MLGAGATLDMVVVQHEADAHALQRVHDLAQRSAQHVEERVRARRLHPAFGDERVALVAVAGRGAEVRPVVEGEHDHGLAAWRHAGTRVQIDIRVVCETDGGNCR